MYNTIFVKRFKNIRQRIWITKSKQKKKKIENFSESHESVPLITRMLICFVTSLVSS